MLWGCCLYSLDCREHQFSETAAASERGDTAFGPGAGPDFPQNRGKRTTGSPLRRGRYRRTTAWGATGTQMGRRGPRRWNLASSAHALRAKGRVHIRSPQVRQGSEYSAHPQGCRGPQRAPQAPIRGKGGTGWALGRSRPRLFFWRRDSYVRRQPPPRFQDYATARRLAHHVPLPRSPPHEHHASALAGRQSEVLQELLGHADISLTLNVYSHVLPDMGDAAAGAMDAALG
jgi:hypothetical protein